MNAVGYVVFDYNEHIKERILEKVEDDSQRNMAKLFSELTDDLMPTPYSKDIDDSYASPALDATYGPTIVAIEQDSDSHQWVYNVEEENKIGYSNDAAAFIFSASEDAYDEKTNGDYASKYTLNDIQTAYWLYLAAHEGGKTPTGRVTANGAKLFAAAEKYAGLNVNPSINDSKAQVIADRANKQYILGPYTLDYDGYKEDVCYVKAISINNDQNLLYDELHDGIKVVIKNGDATERPSSNGEIKKYPKPNGTFFIVLDTAKAGFPTHVSLNVNFEYVSGTIAEGIE